MESTIFGDVKCFGEMVFEVFFQFLSLTMPKADLHVSGCRIRSDSGL